MEAQPGRPRLRRKWEDYTRAKEEMLFHTDTADAPWTIIKADDKKRARLECMRYVLRELPYEGKEPNVIGIVDPTIVGRARDIHERGERILEQPDEKRKAA